MSLPSTELQDIALNLLAQEVGQGVGTDGAAAMKVCGKLGGLLSKLAGTEGFRSLITRALVLSRAEVRWLEQVSVSEDGTLQGIDTRTGIPPDEATKGEVLLIANLLELLKTFIGENLTMQLLKELWPDVIAQEFLSNILPKP